MEALFSSRGHQIRDLTFSFSSLPTMRSTNLKLLPNLTAIQFRFLKGRIPAEMYQHMSEIKSLTRLKFWDLPHNSGLENLTKCKSLLVSCWLFLIAF